MAHHCWLKLEVAFPPTSQFPEQPVYSELDDSGAHAPYEPEVDQKEPEPQVLMDPAACQYFSVESDFFLLHSHGRPLAVVYHPTTVLFSAVLVVSVFASSAPRLTLSKDGGGVGRGAKDRVGYA